MTKLRKRGHCYAAASPGGVRIQIIVTDFSDFLEHLQAKDTPEDKIPAFAREDPVFCVMFLRAGSNPSTAFSRGEMLYHGTDFTEAWYRATYNFPLELEPHPDFDKYLTPNEGRTR